MSFSNEWAEWHLTPRGWERGSEMLDSPGLREKDPPLDRVLSVKWHEEQTSGYARMRRNSSEIWRGDDAALIQRLLKQYGPAPESL